MNADERFPKSSRLVHRHEFDLVFQSEHYAADDVLVIRGRSNGRGHTRLGLSVSRKVGNAVVRNRWKRLIREAFRRQKHLLPSGVDLVVRPRRGAVCRYEKIAPSLVRLARRLEKRLLRS